jgi:ribosomal protein S27AE
MSRPEKGQTVFVMGINKTCPLCGAEVVDSGDLGDLECAKCAYFAGWKTHEAVWEMKNELQSEVERLRGYIRDEHTEPPNDYGDDISTELAVKLAEAEAKVERLNGDVKRLESEAECMRECFDREKKILNAWRLEAERLRESKKLDAEIMLELREEAEELRGQGDCERIENVGLKSEVERLKADLSAVFRRLAQEQQANRLMIQHLKQPALIAREIAPPWPRVNDTGACAASVCLRLGRAAD